MNQCSRYIITIIIILILVGGVIGIEIIRGKNAAAKIDASLEAGDIPVYWNGTLRAAFSPSEIESLPLVTFIDAEEGKTQEGWMLKDILLVYFQESQFKDKTTINVISTSREKSIELTWEEVSQVENMVMFDLAGRGTLKLVSLLDQLDVRDEWIQDVDRIEINTK